MRITCQQFNERTRDFFNGALDRANFLVTNTEALSKVSKVALAIIGFISTILNQFVPGSGAALDILSKLKIGPEGVKVLTDSTGIVERLYEFTDPQKLIEISKTWQKLAARITLAFGQAFETIHFLDSMSIINIGDFGSNMVGKLSIIGFVKNVFFSASSALGIWDAARTIHKAKSNNVAEKLNHWRNTTPQDVTDHIESNQSKYDDDISAVGLRNYKINKYSIKDANLQKDIKKAAISMAADIAKLVIIIFSSIALIFILTAPVALVVMGACGLLAATLGLVKTMYGEFGPKKVPEVLVNPYTARL